MMNYKELVASLAVAQQKTDEQMKRTDEQMKRSDERLNKISKKLDKIGDLVGNIARNQSDLDKLERKMGNFKKLYPKYEDCKIYGALATFHINEDLKKTTLERGFLFCNVAVKCYRQNAVNI